MRKQIVNVKHFLKVAAKKIPGFITSRAYHLVYGITSLMPMKKNMIVFESRGDMCDNAYALFDYMWNNGYREKYEYIWLVEDKERAKAKKLKNVKFASNKNRSFKPKTYYYLARAKYYIYDHDNFIGKLKRKKDHVSFYLWHSINLKAPARGAIEPDVREYPDYVLATSELAAEWNSKLIGIPVDKAKILGLSRNDYFFDCRLKKEDVISRVLGVSQYNKVFLWMPTFRKSEHVSLSENYLHNETGMPLIHTLEEFNKLDQFLSCLNSLLVLKIHPLQASLPIFRTKFSNIIILNNEDLDREGLQLYQFVSCTDALITDYSSISLDFLLLDRPIIFSLDDYEEYAKSRGFVVDNVTDYFAGYHIFNLQELEKSMQDIIEGKDIYKEERKKIINLFHKYQDGNSSKRIVEFLNL